MPPSAHAAQDDNIPGVPITDDFTGTLQAGVDNYDVFRIYLRSDERVQVTMTQLNPPGTSFNLRLYPTSDTFIDGSWIVGVGGAVNPKQITYLPGVGGWYYVVIYAPSGAGQYRLQTSSWYGTPQPPAVPERVWGDDRYTTAVKIAEKNFPGWQNCDHVIIASGEDRAAADPLAAAGLSWTYGAPIMLVQQNRVPPKVTTALQQIAAANGGAVTVHVVGGPVSVPNKRLTEIATQVPGTVTFDRVVADGDRFDLAAAIAARMSAERPAGQMDLPIVPISGEWALIANGADPDKFFDALALSAVSANTGYPILLVEQDRIPAATKAALAGLNLQGRIVGGGPATVSDGVLAQLDAGTAMANRWAGADRYETAAIIANDACNTHPQMLKPHNTGVAAKLPDALAGGAFTGLRGGPVIITPTNHLDAAPRGFLDSWTGDIGGCYVLGGPASVTESTKTQIGQALQP